MTSVTETCRDCQRPRKPDELFCECGAFYDYAVATGEQRTDGEPNGKTVAATTEENLEWPPGQYERTVEPTAPPRVAKRVVCCLNCKALNPATFVTCWSCTKLLVPGVEAEPPWSLRRVLHLEKKPPLRAGERARPAKPFVSKDPRSLLRVGLIVAGVLLLAGALLIGAIKAWGPASAGATNGYGVAREALFPRYEPVYPSSVNPPRGKKPHPPADAFDRNLSTYWQSGSARHVPDKIRVTFNPPAHHIDEVIVFAGDPTGTTIVPAALQMTFYRWESDPTEDSNCERRNRRYFPERLFQKGAFCVKAITGPFELENTPTPQRFSTGKQPNVVLVVITITGVHRSDNPGAKAAITDVEFLDRD